jgi:diaminopimelate epimerase
VSLWDACGNRLFVVVEAATDAELLGRHDRARECFHDARRIADGIAWFAPREGFYRTAFFNPDGSLERLCGNSLLVAAAVLAQEAPAMVCPFDHEPVHVHARERIAARARVPLSSVVRDAHELGPVFDTGSPHLVIVTDDLEDIDLEAFAKPLLDALDVNVTLYALVEDIALVFRKVALVPQQSGIRVCAACAHRDF